MNGKYFLIPIILFLSGFFLCNISTASSLDNWHWRNPLPRGNSLESIVYGNNIYVAVGAEGTIVTSPNGVDWTVRERRTFGFNWLGM